MTTLTQRGPRPHWILIAVAIVVVVAAVAMISRFLGDDLSSATPIVRATPTGTPAFGPGSLDTQDGFLVPDHLRVERAKAEAMLTLQDGYLPPDVRRSPRSATFIVMQDGYLPPAGWGAPARTDTFRPGAPGPQ